MHKDVLRLTILVTCVALATSRLGLLAHELVGHGGTALAVGARVTAVQLFWFAGGWIRYELAQPTTAKVLAIAMGGIAVELVAGLLLYIAVRGDGLGRRIARAIGASLVLHASWYFATGAFHGFGDGIVLRRVLGDARVPVAIAAALVTCGAGFVAAREVLGALAATLPRHRLAGTLAALLIGGAIHAGLAIGELRLRQDVTYAQTMTPERERVVARELEAWRLEQARRGAAVTTEQARTQQQALAEQHREFPFAVVLAIAALLAIGLGAWRTRPAAPGRISTRLLVTAAATAVAAILVVVVIG